MCCGSQQAYGLLAAHSTQQSRLTLHQRRLGIRRPSRMPGADQTITLPARASLDGIVTDDGLPGGSTLTAQWSVDSGGSVSFRERWVSIDDRDIHAGRHVCAAPDGERCAPLVVRHRNDHGASADAREPGPDCERGIGSDDHVAEHGVPLGDGNRRWSAERLDAGDPMDGRERRHREFCECDRRVHVGHVYAARRLCVALERHRRRIHHHRHGDRHRQCCDPGKPAAQRECRCGSGRHAAGNGVAVRCGHRRWQPERIDGARAVDAR